MIKKTFACAFLSALLSLTAIAEQNLCDANAIESQALANYYQLKSKNYPYEIGLFLTGTLTYAAYMTMNPRNPNAQQVAPGFFDHMRMGLGLVFNPMTIAYAGGEKIKAIAGYAYDYVQSAFFGLSENQSAEKQAFLALETAYLKFQHCSSSDLPQKKKVLVEDLFKTTKDLYFIKPDPNSQNHKDVGNVGKILGRIELILSAPDTVKPISLDGELRNKLKNALKTYSKEVNDELFTMASLLADAAECAGQQHCQQTKPTVYFLGGPGTGKTTIAKKFAEIMDIGFIEVRLGQMEAKLRYHTWLGNAKELLDSFVEKEDLDVFTQNIKDAFSQKDKKYKNMIFFLDEIDKIINSSNGDVKQFFLDLLNPETTTIVLRSLGLELDLSSCLFILAGNHPLRNEALRNRMQTLYFTPMPLETRIKVSLAHFDFLQQQDLAKNKVEFNFGEEERNFVIEMAKMDNNPGVRKIKECVERYRTHLKNKQRKWIENDELFPADSCLSTGTKDYTKLETKGEVNTEKGAVEDEEDEDDAKREYMGAVLTSVVAEIAEGIGYKVTGELKYHINPEKKYMGKGFFAKWLEIVELTPEEKGSIQNYVRGTYSDEEQGVMEDAQDDDEQEKLVEYYYTSQIAKAFGYKVNLPTHLNFSLLNPEVKALWDERVQIMAGIIESHLSH